MSHIFTAPTWPVPVFDPGFSQNRTVLVNAFSDYVWPSGQPTGFPMMIRVTTVIGRSYTYIQAESFGLASARLFTPILGGAWTPGGPYIPPGNFVATLTTYWLFAIPGESPVVIGDPVNARVLFSA